jgi:hypothetical protein
MPTTRTFIARPICHDCHTELYSEHGSLTLRAIGHGDARCPATGAAHVPATCEFCDEPLSIDSVCDRCPDSPDGNHHAAAIIALANGTATINEAR